MIKLVENFSRQDLFNHYNSCDNPFLYITTKLDVTKLVNFCKSGYSFYATLGYLLTKVVNKIDQFRYRTKDGKIYFCDRIKTNYTIMKEDGNINYFTLKDNEDFSLYMQDYIKHRDNLGDVLFEENDIDEIWVSCLPWISVSSIITPFKKSVSIPQFLWDKYVLQNDCYTLNFTIMIHHGFADGYHISKLILMLQEEINNIN